jgi:hypothetical protein
MPPLPDLTQFLADTAKVSVLITDASGKIVWANAGFQRITGYGLPAIRGRKPGELLQGDDTDPECVRFMGERIRAGLGFEREVLNYNSAGEPYWVSLEVTPIKDDAGEVTHFIGIQHDITHLKMARAEIESHERLSEELRKSQSFLQSALDSLSAHIAILDETGTIISVNQAWRDFAKGNVEDAVVETVGVNYLEVCERASKSADAPEAALMARGIVEVLDRKRKNFYLQYPCHAPSDERWFQARVARFSVGGEQRLVISHENITEAKIAERRLREHLERLSHVQRLETMGEMSAALAHELNQPLSAISNYTSGSVRRLRVSGTVTPEVLEAMQHALDEANRAAEIIRRMRRFSRNAEVQREPGSVNDIVEEALQLVGEDARRRSIKLEKRLGSDLPIVLVDAIHLQQVLINLVRNAADAMENIPESERIVIISTGSPDAQRVEIRVTDQGSGIAQEALEHLFDPFMTTKAHGMGLGLAICRSIIEAHHGRIWAETNLDDGGRTTGATFGIVLPAATMHADPETTGPAQTRSNDDRLAEPG